MNDSLLGHEPAPPQAIALLVASAVLAAASVAPWLVRPFFPDLYREVFHMIGTVQGALTCGVAGVLVWQIPKRANTRPPGWLSTWVIIGCGVTTVATAFFRHELPYDILLGIGQGAWLLAVQVIAYITVHRLKGMPSRPVATTWYLLAMAIGVAGAVLLSAYSMTTTLEAFRSPGADRTWLRFIGRGWLLQCLFLGVIIGWMHDKAEIAGQYRSHSAQRAKFRAVACMAALVASVPLELWGSTRLGLSVRMAGTLYGLHTAGFFASRLSAAHIATGSIPLGYVVGAMMPHWRVAGLHVVFIGGFVAAPLLWMAADAPSERMTWLRRSISLLGVALVLRAAADVMTSLDNRVGVVALAATAFVMAMAMAVMWLVSWSTTRR